MVRPAFWIDVAIKAALIGQLAVAVAWPDLPQFEGKAFAGRAIAYPIAVLLWTLPFLIDVSGNTADLYDTIGWWDDANHFVNWGILVAAFGQLLIRLPIGRLEAAALAIGFGAVTALLWEFGEYLTFIRFNEEEFRTAYTDTLGDLALGLGGSVVATILIATVLWPVRSSASPAAAR